jgi:hypothetical protein
MSFIYNLKNLNFVRLYMEFSERIESKEKYDIKQEQEDIIDQQRRRFYI